VYNERVQAWEEEMETEDITIQFQCDESECDQMFTKKSSEITSDCVSCPYCGNMIKVESKNRPKESPIPKRKSEIEGAVDDINKAFSDLGDINIDLGF
jgi:hypothetical protein